ncbi:MAG TPA: zinc-ribbon domain-containing protein [Ktedonobacteraceae bacterium]|nr:zinc-ribbon domain-containing protein [Ktedonobacteraceae bacterium]
MMTCATCGQMIPDNATSCPYCGALTALGRASQPQAGYYQQGYMPPPQQPGYNPQQGYVPPQQEYYQQPNYGQPYQQNSINVTVTNTASSQSSSAVVVEVLLNIFLGIYGVGWLMAGETTTGIIMLICSFVVYWPITIAIGIFTVFVGYACWFPLLIAAWIVNAILLNGALKRKAAQVIMVQQRY